MEKMCGDCKKFRKKPFTTVFECLKYETWLNGKPPMRCKQCLEDEKPKKQPKKTGDEFIEVK